MSIRRTFVREFARLVEISRLARGRLRAAMLALRGAEVGRKTTIGSGCRFDRPWCIVLGERVTIEDQVVFKIVADEARVIIGHHAFLGRGTQLDIIERATIVQSDPSRLISATPSGMMKSSSSGTSPLRPYIRSCSMKMTGLSSRIDDFSNPFASAAVDGKTTLRPGKFAYIASIACECCDET